jgi:flagellar assembly factor FliW
MKTDTCDQDAVVVKPYSRLVSLTIRPEHVFHLPQGLPAFEEFKNYVFTIKPDTSPFIFMQSIEPAGLSFVCIDPFLVYPNYAPRIGTADQEILRLSRPESLMLLSIVTVRADERETTANLQGPLAINIENSIGKQILCDGQTYPVRYRIWDAINRAESTADAAPMRYGIEHACA